MARRPRGLRPEERELWQQVARTAEPLRDLPPFQASDPAPDQPPRLPAAQAPLPSFRVGERHNSPPPGHDLRPGLSEGLAAAPLRMDRKSFNRMKRGKLLPEARIDLHGMTVAEAHPALTRFILSSHGAGKRLVLVITGKGRRAEDEGLIPRHPGILKRQVPQWLTMAPLGAMVLQITEAHLRHGGTGAYYIYLRRPR